MEKQYNIEFKKLNKLEKYKIKKEEDEKQKQIKLF